MKNVMKKLLTFFLLLGLSTTVLGSAESSSSASGFAGSSRGSPVVDRSIFTEKELDFLVRFDGSLEVAQSSLAQQIIEKFSPDILRLDTLLGDVFGVNLLAFDEKTSRLAYCGRHNDVALLNLLNGACVSLTRFSLPISKGDFMRIGDRLFFASATSSFLNLTDLAHNGHSEFDLCSAYAFNKTGSLLATVSGGTICVRNQLNHTFEREFEWPVPVRIMSVAFATSDSVRAAILVNKHVFIYSDNNAEEMTNLANQPDLMPVRVCFSPDAKFVAVVFENNALGIWRVSDNKLITLLPPASGKITEEQFSADGKLLVRAVDSAIYIVNVERSPLPVVCRGHCAPITQLIFDDANHSLLSASVDGTVRRWALDGSSSHVLVRCSTPINSMALCCVPSHSSSTVVTEDDKTVGQFLVTACADRNELCLWLTDPRAILLQIKAVCAPVFVTMDQYERIKELLEKLPPFFRKTMMQRFPFLKCRKEPAIELLVGEKDTHSFLLTLVDLNDGRHDVDVLTMQHLCSPVLIFQLQWNSAQTFSVPFSGQAIDQLCRLAQISIPDALITLESLNDPLKHEVLMLYDYLCCCSPFGHNSSTVLRELFKTETTVDRLTDYGGAIDHLPPALQDASILYSPRWAVRRMINGAFFSNVRSFHFEQPFCCGAVSPDAVHIALGVAGGVYHYDIITGRSVFRRLGGTDTDSLIAWSADSTRYAITHLHEDVRSVSVFDVITDRTICSFDFPSTAKIEFLAFYSDGVLVFYKDSTMSPAHLVKCSFDSDMRKELMVPANATACAVSADGQLAVIGTVNGKIFMGDINHEGIDTLLVDQSVSIAALALNADGTCLTSVCDDGTVSIYTGNVARRLRNHLVFGDGGYTLVSRVHLIGWRRVPCVTLSSRDSYPLLMIGTGSHDRTYVWEKNTNNVSVINKCIIQQDQQNVFCVSVEDQNVNVEFAWPEPLTLKQVLLIEKAFKAPELVDDVQRSRLRTILETLPEQLQALVLRLMPDFVVARAKREEASSSEGSSSDAPAQKRCKEHR